MHYYKAEEKHKYSPPYRFHWEPLKGHSDVNGACVSVTLRLRVGHECARRWVRRWLGFAAAAGEHWQVPRRPLIPVIADFKPPRHATATRRPRIVWRLWNSAKNTQFQGAVWRLALVFLNDMWNRGWHSAGSVILKSTIGIAVLFICSFSRQIPNPKNDTILG